MGRSETNNCAAASVKIPDRTSLADILLLSLECGQRECEVFADSRFLVS
ncbi:hypothetical protein Q5691_14515 [Microcoleus sp. w1-18aA5]